MSRPRPSVAILDYDAGNVRSAKRGFDTAGADASIVREPSRARRADALVVPGVGHFSSCLAQLRRTGLEPVLHDAIAEQRPVFGICVGMQLLYGRSQEGDEPGLGLLPGHVERFPRPERRRPPGPAVSETRQGLVPHMGWDVVRAAEGSEHDPLLAGVDGERLYFVHSYYAVPTDADHVVARTAYGGVDFPCLVRDATVVGTQFHPEKSGAVGAKLLTNWVASLG